MRWFLLLLSWATPLSRLNRPSHTSTLRSSAGLIIVYLYILTWFSELFKRETSTGKLAGRMKRFSLKIGLKRCTNGWMSYKRPNVKRVTKCPNKDQLSLECPKWIRESHYNDKYQFNGVISVKGGKFRALKSVFFIILTPLFLEWAKLTLYSASPPCITPWKERILNLEKLWPKIWHHFIDCQVIKHRKS